jgi:hypothetical protein
MMASAKEIVKLGKNYLFLGNRATRYLLDSRTIFDTTFISSQQKLRSTVARQASGDGRCPLSAWKSARLAAAG